MVHAAHPAVEDAPREILVFVYGTLRRGERAHRLLQDAPCVAEGVTEPRFTLVDLGVYPALVEGGDTAVAGEVYAVDPETLVELDRYEEAPEVYRRAVIRVSGRDVFAYLLPAQLATGYPHLPHGNWCKRERPHAM